MIASTTLTKLRTTFENTFNSELKARMQNYTRYDAQSFYDAMIFNMDSLGKHMLELILHQQRTPQLLKQKKLMQTQKDHSNPIPALNVDSLKVVLACLQTIVSDPFAWIKNTSSKTDMKRRVNKNIDAEAREVKIDYEDIRPIYDEEPMAEVQLTAECNIFAIGQQHTEQPEIIVEGIPYVMVNKENLRVWVAEKDDISGNHCQCGSKMLIQKYESVNNSS
ncbi:hypothetical protein Tco_1092650 [Tanacetum coccineum]|uniref:Uncharacterized protein n=1 Tax=Tanacetum coccineum TaxID=301880 RepID=A0ABQ5ICW2_9ASTR